LIDDTRKDPLILASLRARMGNWTYYIAFMKMKEIAQRIDPANSFYSSKTLQELLQRQVLSGRAKEIEHYLAMQEQRFFNALVIGTYGGDPQWKEMVVKQTSTSVLEIPGALEGTMGFLFLDGSEKLFAIDGQHRVEGIRLAVKDHQELESEEVCVILVRGITGEHRSEDEEGFERTRRLFTTLNRYAKPVSKKDIIALDEDDAVAIITRRLVEDYPLFSGRKTSVKAATSISVSDKQCLTSINALYDGLDIYLISGAKAKWRKFKRFYPGDEEIDRLYKSAIDLWENYCKHFPPLKEVRDSGPNEEIARKYRTADGGNILFRPIGLLMFVKVVRQLIDYSRLTLEQAVKRVSKVPMELSGEPWAHLTWNPRNRKIITASQNRKAAEKLLFNAVGGDLSVLKSSPDSLRRELAAIKNIEVRDIILPSYVGV
jgi:DNA sulfur modification protein DndB